MARYVDAEKIELKYEFGMVSDEGIICIPMRDVKKSIDATPAADVVEIKHGKWLHNNTECSVCKSLNPTMYLNEYELEYKALPLPHCPHCCAKMDGGKEE